MAPAKGILTTLPQAGNAVKQDGKIMQGDRMK